MLQLRLQQKQLHQHQARSFPLSISFIFHPVFTSSVMQDCSLVLLLGAVAILLSSFECIRAQEEEVGDPSAISDVFLQIGDMTIVSPPTPVSEEKRSKRLAVSSSLGLWPGAVIPYEIPDDVFTSAEKRLILESMKHWENCTCIRFRPRTESDPNGIIFMQGQPFQCRSYIGRVRHFARQGVTLGSGCFVFDTIVHELGHAIGFFHEHSRPDRDDYVNIHTQNIIHPSLESAFAIERDAKTLGFGYDYASIMHYAPTTFAQRGTTTISARHPEIHFGQAKELSPLDAAKTNALYSCGPHDTHPPPSVVVTKEDPITRPLGTNCGAVINATKSGVIQTPGYPSHRTNQRCAYVLTAPKGYGFEIRFTNFVLDQSTGCSQDYVQMFRGASISQGNVLNFGLDNNQEGRLCGRSISTFVFPFGESQMTLLYITDGRNTDSNSRGVRISYSIVDINECQPNGRVNQCHSCTNTEGSFKCECRRGYYHSYAANICYDVNECAFNNGGCQQRCENFGGSYRCSCTSGFLQSDGLSCGPARPVFVQNPTPGTIIPKIQTSATTTPTPPPTTTPTTRPTTPTTRPTTPTTQPTTPTTRPTTPTTRPTTPTTRPTTPTTRPTVPPTTPTLPQECGSGPKILTNQKGYIETVGWPNSAYPAIADCSWNIICPADMVVSISFENSFRVAGQMPACTKDQLLVYDCEGRTQYGPFCHLSSPDPFTTSCNQISVVFRANNERGISRTGFRMNYECVTPEEEPSVAVSTIPPPTMLPEECGGGLGTLTASSGAIQTVGWPNSPYPLDAQCSWKIVCPVGSKVEISFESSFRIAGQMPDCTKDQLKVLDCEGETLHGPFCHLSRPRAFNSTCNSVNVIFQSNGGRGETRTGFRLNYRCSTDAPNTTPVPTATSLPPKGTIPTDAIEPTISPECGGGPQVRTDTSGVIQTLNWNTQPYPVDTNCLWRVQCPPSMKVKIVFHSSFRIAGAMPACTKDQLNIIGCNGSGSEVDRHGPFCHLTAPRPIELKCSSADISFRSGSSRGDTRTGFRLGYTCIN